MSRNQGTHTTVLSNETGVRGCGGKRCYPDHATAERLAKKTRRDRECQVSAYKCRRCHRWHIGDANS